MMSQDYVFHDSKFAAAVGAAAFSIYSVEQTEANYRRTREEFEKSKIEIKTRRDDTGDDGSVGVTRSSTRQDQRYKESGLPARMPSRSSSMRRVNSADQKLKKNSTRSTNVMESKTDSWENAQLRKINKRYDKLKSDILTWENAKKMQAKLQLERKQNELEMKRQRNKQHYQNKLARIDLIAGGAKAQLEEKRRNEESEVKERARYMRSKGKGPVSCFCC